MNRTGTTKLTPEREQRIVQLLKAGQHRSTVCHAVGIGERTLRTWLARADEGDERWTEFARRVREAEAECETRAIVAIQVKGKDDWRAMAWWLERRFPLRWGETRGAQAKLDAEREGMLEALVRVLDRRGLGDAAEEVIRELAGDSGEETGSNQSAVGATH